MKNNCAVAGADAQAFAKDAQAFALDPAFAKALRAWAFAKCARA